LTRFTRLLKALGADELARRVGRSASTVRRWERAGAAPEAATDDLRTVERRRQAARVAAEARAAKAAKAREQKAKEEARRERERARAERERQRTPKALAQKAREKRKLEAEREKARARQKVERAADRAAERARQKAAEAAQEKARLAAEAAREKQKARRAAERAAERARQKAAEAAKEKARLAAEAARAKQKAERARQKAAAVAQEKARLAAEAARAKQKVERAEARKRKAAEDRAREKARKAAELAEKKARYEAEVARQKAKEEAEAARIARLEEIRRKRDEALEQARQRKSREKEEARIKDAAERERERFIGEEKKKRKLTGEEELKKRRREVAEACRLLDQNNTLIAEAIGVDEATIRRWMIQPPLKSEAFYRLRQVVSDMHTLFELMKLSGEVGALPKIVPGSGVREGRQTAGVYWTRGFMQMLTPNLIRSISKWIRSLTSRLGGQSFPLWQAVAMTSQFAIKSSVNFNEVGPKRTDRDYKTVFRQINHPKWGDFAHSRPAPTSLRTSAALAADDMVDRLTQMYESGMVKVFIHGVTVFSFRQRSLDEQRAWDTAGRKERKAAWKQSRKRK